MIKISQLFLIFLFVPAVSVIAGEQQNAPIGDFALENGSLINNCQIGYRVYGKANEDRSNIILFPTWFGGTSEHVGALIGPQGLLDSSRYQIIIVDALGNGISSSPSNYKKGPFPRFTVRDMVRSQYVLLTKVLGIPHVFAVVGGSMGGMQTFEWLVSYPEFMDKAVPYVGTPHGSSYDRLLWQTELNMIRSGQRYGMPVDSIMGLVASVQQMVARTPQYLAENTSRPDVDKIIREAFQERERLFTMQNYAAQIEAMLAHNVAAPFGDDMNRAAGRVKADVFVIVSASDHIVQPLPALDFAALIGAQTLVLDSDCGHLAVGCRLKEVGQAIARFLDNR